MEDKKVSRGRLLWALIPLAIVVLAVIFGKQLIGAFGEFADYMAYPFMRRALIVGLCVSLSAALLGVSLVLKRYSMIGDGLSHVGFGALAGAMAMGYVSESSVFYPAAHFISAHPVAFTTAVVMLLAFLLLRLNSSGRIKGDAAIAILSTAALALGVVIVSVTDGMNVDISNFMFGSILSVDAADVWPAVGMSAAVVIAFFAAYHRIFAVTFDEPFSKSSGLKTGLYNMLLAALTSVTIVIGMRLMGTMLISSLIIFPALTAMRVFARFKQVVICAAAVSVVCFVTGLMLSCVYSLPTGAAVVLVNLSVFVVFTAIGKIRE